MDTSKSQVLAERQLPVITLLMVGSAVLIALIPSMSPWLVYDRDAILSGQIWRLLNGHWVHFSGQHLAYDLLAFGVTGWIIEARKFPRFGWLCVVAPWAINAVLIVAEPQMSFCGGFSGLATSAVVSLAVFGLRDTAPWRWVCLAALLAIVAKILFESITGQIVFATIENLPTVSSVSSHCAGAMLGLTFAVGVGPWPVANHNNASAKRKVLNHVREIGRNAGFGQQFQFIDELADRQGELWREDDAAEGNTTSLPHSGFNQ